MTSSGTGGVGAGHAGGGATGALVDGWGAMDRTYDWHFPLPRTHTGMLQGNGTLGAMIWGEGNVLRLTLNRADFWDHRGGLPWVERMSYAAIGDLLARGDEAGLRALFGGC